MTVARPPETQAPAPEAGADTESPDHDEWLLDEALAETFPASDPIRPATPPDTTLKNFQRAEKR